MMPRMRTIDQCAAWLLEIDPETALTKTALRRLVISGQLPSINIGTKYLIDLDTLESYLRGTDRTAAPAQPQGIRAVNL